MALSTRPVSLPPLVFGAVIGLLSSSCQLALMEENPFDPQASCPQHPSNCADLDLGSRFSASETVAIKGTISLEYQAHVTEANEIEYDYTLPSSSSLTRVRGGGQAELGCLQGVVLVPHSTEDSEEPTPVFDQVLGVELAWSECSKPNHALAFLQVFVPTLEGRRTGQEVTLRGSFNSPADSAGGATFFVMLADDFINERWERVPVARAASSGTVTVVSDELRNGGPIELAFDLELNTNL
jgi:hypothetical protein